MWLDNENALETRPDIIEIYLYANGEDTGRELTLTAREDWKGEFADLDVHDEYGQEIYYTIVEREIPSYSAIIEGNMDDGLTIYNVYDGYSFAGGPPVTLGRKENPVEPESPVEPETPEAKTPSEEKETPADKEPSAEKETPSPSGKVPPSGGKPAAGGNPRTGDESNAALWIMLAAMALAGIISSSTLLAIRRKKGQ